jgi:hypothetical protein
MSFEMVLSALKSVLRIRDVYPGSRILIFIHPGSKNRERGEKKFDQFSNFFGLFTLKIVAKLSKISQIRGSKRHRIPVPNPDPQH